MPLPPARLASFPPTLRVPSRPGPRCGAEAGPSPPAERSAAPAAYSHAAADGSSPAAPSRERSPTGERLASSFCSSCVCSGLLTMASMSEAT
eukprot:scaffold12806_cov104-Isochrysis_galbana.AAC.2